MVILVLLGWFLLQNVNENKNNLSVNSTSNTAVANGASSASLTLLRTFTVQDPEAQWANGKLAWDPVRRGLFFIGHTHEQHVGEIDLNGTTIQPFVNAFGASIDLQTWGLLVSGDKLIASSQTDGVPAPGGVSHYVRSSNLIQGGPTAITVSAPDAAWVAGYFARIPTAWQTALGGDLIVGQGMPRIVSRSSFGPSASVVREADMLRGGNVSATMVLGYPSNHPLGNSWETSPSIYFNGSGRLYGAVVVGDELWVIGRQGMGAMSGPGHQAPPHRAQLWTYKLADLVKVKNGQMQIWEPPVDIRPIPDFPQFDDFSDRGIYGAAYDVEGGLLYLSDLTPGQQPLIRVYTVGVGTPTPPPPTPTPTPTPPVPPPPTPSNIPGDLNNDGRVDTVDWSYMSNVWLTNDPVADLDGNGLVNSLDFSVLNTNWFRTN